MTPLAKPRGFADYSRRRRFRRLFIAGGTMMKAGIAALALGASLFTGSALAATTDDVKWINQCVRDNKGDAPDSVILKYCTCMNNKMSDNETQSITQWEKTHVAERKACDRASGWR
jgi:hypothetical protein